MNQNGMTIPNAVLMTLLGSASLGGFLLALSTMKNGKEWRNGLLALAGRSKAKAGPSDLMGDEIEQVAFI